MTRRATKGHRRRTLVQYAEEPKEAQRGQPETNGTETLTDFPASGHLDQFIDGLFPNAATDDFEVVDCGRYCFITVICR